MAWNPDDDLPDDPLHPHERKKVRRVIHWYDRRTFLRASLAVWARWLLALPAAIVAIWQFVLYIRGGK